MANVAAIRIENVRLAEVEEADRIMQRDLTQAAEIQRRMLPDERRGCRAPTWRGSNAACRTVGGDYYDFFSVRRQPRRPGAGRRLRQRYAGLPHDDGAACARAGAGRRSGRSGVVHDAAEQGHVRQVPRQPVSSPFSSR